MGGGDVLLVGLCTVDLVHRVAKLPTAGQKLQSTAAVELVAGGPAANAAVTAAALGSEARLVTILGSHPLAGLARADLTAHGVRVVDLRPELAEPPTVSTVVVRDRDGERIVVSHNAADVCPPATMPLWWPLLVNVGAVLVDGHHPTLAVAAARAARGRRVPVVLDAGSDKHVLSELLPLVDVCACSASFRLGRATARGTERAVHGAGVPVVIRTDGAAPVRWSVRLDGRVTTGYARPPAVVPRDTLGAGDAWHGALAAGVARLGRVPSADELTGLVESANRVAATRVGMVGARAWLARLNSD
ncbi:MAG TPA: PfkB family carbohydrate kinase [Pseudonocardiaceae bacterium]|nr:PfkB family carbohydrate kinase [Pseudonocardiaceae bacterium]